MNVRPHRSRAYAISPSAGHSPPTTHPLSSRNTCHDNGHRKILWLPLACLAGKRFGYGVRLELHEDVAILGSAPAHVVLMGNLGTARFLCPARTHAQYCRRPGGEDGICSHVGAGRALPREDYEVAHP